MGTHSQRLRQTISLTRGHLTSLIREVWFHPRLGEVFPEFLFAMYGVTLPSAPTMRIAADRCAAMMSEDPLAASLRTYYLHHVEEEAGHEEPLLVDLASLGVTRERALQRLPYPSVAALVGMQYYWVLHVHPVAYMGYLAVAEEAPEIAFLEEVSDRTGIPLSSMTCHVMHAQLDPGHVEEFDATLDALPLTAWHQDLIAVNAIATVAHLENFFTDVLEHFNRIDHPANAGSIFTSAGPVLA
ncbi:MAG: hypothetical protein WA869_03440 [Alloacidobacterium sp.]